METYFAPAKRTERRKFKNQIADISTNPIMNALLKTTAGLLVVLNEDRQIVALNHAFLDKLGLKDPEAALGLRLGETLHCLHAYQKPNGCGTTEACISCGAAIAMMTAIVSNKSDEKICALITNKEDELSHVCLLIQAQPMQLDNHRWIFIYAQDVTQQHFWLNLERVFFHDVSNILTSLHGNISLMSLKQPENEEVQNIQLGVERLIKEVSMQKAFTAHRQEGFKVQPERIDVSRIKQEVQHFIDGHGSTRDICLIQDWPDRQLEIVTDPLLASRVIGNIIINACEASDPGQKVTLETSFDEKTICWEVFNQKEIPPHIRPRIFQRFFSTKTGTGRGLGTYSMKLFGEQYLGGNVDFTSSKQDGTCFKFTLPLNP